ncbi:MAG: OmpA family protein [Candidatus Binataceae bacterium]
MWKSHRSDRCRSSGHRGRANQRDPRLSSSTPCEGCVKNIVSRTAELSVWSVGVRLCEGIPPGRLGSDPTAIGRPAQAQQTIAKMAAILAPQQTTKINMTGYTDNTPIGPGLMNQGVTSNLILSQRRADNVMQYMISQGVNPNLVSAQGFGDADPVASNATPEGKAQNRRVELTLANSGG